MPTPHDAAAARVGRKLLRCPEEAQLELIDLFSPGADLSVPRLAISLVLGAIIAAVLRTFFVRYARSTSDAAYFSRSFAPLLLSIVLIIAVIRTSLALSLGLVGALSIVRFRTPIKDPEELTFLLMVIAAGIGLGAEQWVATGVAVGAILALLAFQSARRHDQAIPGHVLFDLSGPAIADVESARALLVEHCETLTTLRAEADADRAYLSVQAIGMPEAQVAGVVGQVRAHHPGVEVAAVHTPLRSGP